MDDEREAENEIEASSHRKDVISDVKTDARMMRGGMLSARKIQTSQPFVTFSSREAFTINFARF